MTWVKRAVPAVRHGCAPPMVERKYTLPASLNGGTTATHTELEPAGVLGDLWRCDRCGSLWQIACGACDSPRSVCLGGLRHERGSTWRPASWWQRIRYRKKPAAAPPVKGGDID